MTKSIHISLRAGESIFVNGAILTVDRKVSIGFRNDVVFLLESHMLKPEQATTPLKKMYVNVQRLLTEPSNGFAIRQSFYEMHMHLIAACDCEILCDGLMDVKAKINNGRNYEALKTLRKLFAAEENYLSSLENLPPVKVAANQGK